MKTNKVLIRLLVSLFGCTISSTYAVDMNARDFFTQPAGAWSSVSYLGYDHASNFRGPADTNNNANLKIGSFVHRLVRFTDCGGFMCSPQIVIPALHMDIQGPGAPDSKSKTGIGDVSLGAGFWFINKPEERRFMGILPTVIIPVGQYDENNPGVSPGGNRWQFHLNLNNTWALSEKWTMELEAEAQFYTRNSDYMGMSYRQKPIYKIKSYLSYEIDPANYVAARVIYGIGGKTKLDGQKLDDTHTKLTQIGVEYGHALFKSNHLLFGYTRDVDAKNSFQGNHFQIRFIHGF
ncbi:transporter [Zophobihabitans entericus]|uniref:Transporter n=1 Tax=Zophobihabitans entericus TaxID=1635327 RepID=A0A6G9I9P4_9GAMM|nr:transporter [Zophobihabitans entericus]QIQ20557.1 transporter [Zophobihabitans entericus]